MMRIGIVVGEISGDNLGANLIDSLRQHYPDLQVEGILGPKIIQQGYQSMYPMERLSIMGIVEPLKRLPELIRMYRHVIRHFSENPPDIFIGIDAPDFNLRIEKKLRERGIKTAHYVSPTVWAWRQWRIHGIKKSIDLMLSIFPFEVAFYNKHEVPIKFCGHPLADQIPLENDIAKSKQQLFEYIQNPQNHMNNNSMNGNPIGINPISNNKNLKLSEFLSDPILAILPGSRNSELEHLAEIYLRTAVICQKQYPSLQCVVPVVSQKHKEKIQMLHQQMCPQLPLIILVSQTKMAIAAADVVLVTSGTATLEVMLHKKPMVVGFRANPISFHLVKLLVKVPYISQPNLLANERLVPEYIQKQATAENLSKALIERLDPNFPRSELIAKFTDIHQQLRQNAGNKAAEAIIELCSEQ